MPTELQKMKMSDSDMTVAEFIASRPRQSAQYLIAAVSDCLRRHGIVSVTDVGEHGDNVLLGDDGIVYFIDPLIRLHHSAAETIRLLTGVDPELTIK